MTYSQTTGVLSIADGKPLCTAYAGRGGGKNSHVWQAVKDIGPLPCGWYTLQALVHVDRLGWAIFLQPDDTNAMMGRDGFFFHLPNPKWPHDSSDGCIVVPLLEILQAIAASPDKRLQVIE